MCGLQQSILQPPPSYILSGAKIIHTFMISKFRNFTIFVTVDL